MCVSELEATICLRLFAMANKENDPDVDDFKPPMKRPKLTNWMKVFLDQCFRAQKFDEEMKMVHGYVPLNTAKNTSWAMKVFGDWCAVRNVKLSSGEEECPKDLFENLDMAKFNFCLPRFVSEVCKQDGEPYPPKSIHQILAGLQRYMLEKNLTVPKFLDVKESHFRDFHGACDFVYWGLHQQGIGHASVITAKEGEQLWSSRVIDITTPQSLKRGVHQVHVHYTSRKN